MPFFILWKHTWVEWRCCSVVLVDVFSCSIDSWFSCLLMFMFHKNLGGCSDAWGCTVIRCNSDVYANLMHKLSTGKRINWWAVMAIEPKRLTRCLCMYMIFRVQESSKVTYFSDWFVLSCFVLCSLVANSWCPARFEDTAGCCSHLPNWASLALLFKRLVPCWNPGFMVMFFVWLFFQSWPSTHRMMFQDIWCEQSFKGNFFAVKLRARFL